MSQKITKRGQNVTMALKLNTCHNVEEMDKSNTEEDKMSDEQALTHTQSYQQLEPPPSRSCILQTCFQKV